MSLFGNLFSNDAAQQAANTSQGILAAGLGTASNQIGTGLGRASGYLDTASSILGGSKANYAPFMPGALNAWNQYAALIGGDPAAAEAALTSQPGFKTQMDLAQQAGNRAAAAGGMGASGNAIMSAMNISRGLEEANINNYASRLLAMAGYGPQIAGAETSIDAALAGVQGQQAANQMTAGGELAGLTTQAFNTDAQNQANAALAQQQAAANVWNAIMGIGGLGVKAATGGIIPGITPTKAS